MLIAIIGNSAESLLNFRASLIKYMIRSGHEVVAFAPDYDRATRDAIRRMGAEPSDFTLARGGTNPWADLKTIMALRSGLARRRPDAVLSYFIKPAVYGTLAAFLVGTPRRVALIEGLGYGFAEQKRPTLRRRFVAWAVRALLRLGLARAQTVLVLNAEDQQTLVEQVGVGQDRVTNMGGIGVELERFGPAPVRERAAVFALAARLIAEKGIQDYVEAARLVVLGDVDDNPTSLTREQMASWRDAGIIEWPGRVAEIQDWLSQADVFVLPSYYREGVPRSTQEAMALGRAIITTDNVGCRDTVVDGVNGFLVPPRQPEALARAMRRLIDTPGLARQMGKASRRLAEERFDAAQADARILRTLTLDPETMT
jgi:glycosyltransferase involved in cell wall biosynthesis